MPDWSTSVSIILPVCNAEKTLLTAVSSIFSQAYADWELILVENGSDDGTLNICRQLARKNNRVTCISLFEKGIAKALNEGIRHASYPFIARMDADDFSFPDRLEKQVRFLTENPEYGLVSGLVDMSGDGLRNDGYREYINQINSWISEDQLKQYRFIESPFPHPSVMFRKNIIDTYGGYSTDPIPEDYELWLRWFSKGVKMAKLPQTVIRWSDSPGRLSRTHAHYSKEAFDWVRYHYLAEYLRDIVSAGKHIYVWGGGKLAKHKLRRLQTQIPFSVKGIIDVKPKEKLQRGLIHFSEIPEPENTFIISLVSNRGVYREIEEFLLKRNYKPDRDFICAG
jgi:glycosyltransferase involved in cell wall biosynthesis